MTTRMEASKTVSKLGGRQGSWPRIEGLRAEVVTPAENWREELLEQAQAVAQRTGTWPVDEHASAWLVTSATETTDPAPSGRKLAPELLMVRVTPTKTLYALRFGGTAEVIAPDSETAAQALPVLFDALPPGTLVWARGLRSPVAAAALGLGLTPIRRILVLVRHPDRPVAQPRLPAGFRLRPFRVGADETQWLELNRAAFAALPDQSGWGLTDLQTRLQADWFDPSNFLVLESPESALVGCIWVKIEAPSQPAALHNAVHPGGEIYVLSVHPNYHGLGLGRALLMAGLVRIHAAGHHEAHLYVDTTNTSAGRLYSAAGFVQRERVLAFAKPGKPGGNSRAVDTGPRGGDPALD